MNLDYLIIGQGMAGTMLAHFLIKHNRSLRIIDAHNPSSASHVSAGTFNPVTGRRMVKSWMVDQLLPFAADTYQEIASLVGKDLYFKKDIYKVHAGIKEQNDITAKSGDPEMSSYLVAENDDNRYTGFIHAPYGGVKVACAGRIDSSGFITAYRNYLKQKEVLIEDQFRPEELVVSKSGAEWKDYQINKVVFCEGYHTINNPWFKWLPFVLTKGELLVVRIPGFPEDRIIRSGIGILPIGNGLFFVGATYNWDTLDEIPSEEGRSELVQKLEKSLKTPYEIIDHKAGIRPTVKDRRPFLGHHPIHKNLYVFNGLGTKAVMLAPWFANQFVEFLENKGELDREVNIKRYYSYFS